METKDSEVVLAVIHRLAACFPSPKLDALNHSAPQTPNPTS